MAARQQIDSRPLYVQVQDLLVGRISSGALKPGVALPSEFQIGHELGVSQGTVRKALDGLAIEGLVVRRQGRGTFVVEQTPEEVHFRFVNIFGEDGTLIIPDSQDARVSTSTASKAERDKLHLERDSRVIRIRRFRTYQSERFIAECIVIADARFPGLENRSPIPNTLYDLYQADFGVLVVRADDQLTAIAANDRASRQLGVAYGSPLLQIERLAYDIDGLAVEWRVSVCRLVGMRYVAQLGVSGP